MNLLPIDKQIVHEKIIQEGEIMKLIAQNKKAYHDYFIEDTFEAGLVLKGTEIKSIRHHSVSLKDSYIRIQRQEAFVVMMHIAPYEHGSLFNHDPYRDRKLLLHKKEILKLERTIKESGMTLIPLKLYMKDGRVKLELGVAKGKKMYDKRQVEREKDAKREVEKALKGRF